MCIRFANILFGLLFLYNVRPIVDKYQFNFAFGIPLQSIVQSFCNILAAYTLKFLYSALQLIGYEVAYIVATASGSCHIKL